MKTRRLTVSSTYANEKQVPAIRLSGAYTGISGRRNRRHPDFKPETSGHLSIDLIL